MLEEEKGRVVRAIEKQTPYSGEVELALHLHPFPSTLVLSRHSQV